MKCGKCKFFNTVGLFSLLWIYGDCVFSATSPLTVRMNSWVTLSAAGKYSLKAPPGSQVRKRVAKDSSGVIILTPTAELLSDYGLYSNPLKANRTQDNYIVQPVSIDGREAIIVTWDAGAQAEAQQYFIGVHFPELSQSSIGSVKLTIQTFVEEKSDYELIKIMFSSIRFSK